VARKENRWKLNLNPHIVQALDGMGSLKQSWQPFSAHLRNVADCLPAAARAAAVHLATVTCAEVDFLLTWNCRHLVNAQILRRLEREADRLGWELPTICTPPELMGDFFASDER
jgi:hypothetical protein